MHLTTEDLQALKETFATKDDLSRLQTALDKRFDQQDARLKRELEAQKTALLDSIRSYLENNLTPFILDHEQRLKRIEDQLDLSSTSTNGHN